PESDWIITEQPDLRIIPQPLWDRVQQRRKSQSQSQQTQLGRGPKYLLSGLLKCDECDSNFVVSDYYRYACGGHLNRGASVCKNALRVSRNVVEERCLAALRDELLTPDAVERIIQKATRLFATRNRERQPELERMQRQLATVENEIANLLKAIKAGILTQSTKTELQRAETERTRLHKSIPTRTTKADKVATLLPRGGTLSNGGQRPGAPFKAARSSS
ncbi:MAG: recombinase zinc beta ribbon domain-containing protein, partial [Nitrospirae bacterium]|nr:recombinase zinc beta ribbon domain-containing protein [Nitrospirota bacterium]